VRRAPSPAWPGRTRAADAARERIEVALAMIDALDRQLAPLEQHLRARAPPLRLPRADAQLRQRAGHRDQHRLRTGRRVAPVGAAQGGALRRPHVGVNRSDRRTRQGKPTRPGTPQLRWAL
jgi:hypothetical protein